MISSLDSPFMNDALLHLLPSDIKDKVQEYLVPFDKLVIGEQLGRGNTV